MRSLNFFPASVRLPPMQHEKRGTPGRGLPSTPDADWFEFRDVRKRSITRAAWVPLCCYDATAKRGRFPEVGYAAEFFGYVGVMFPVERRDDAMKLGWTDVSAAHGHKPEFDDGEYHRADDFIRGNLRGVVPVLEQYSELSVGHWLLHPDIILGLQLNFDTHSWVRPEEGFADVVRLSSDDKGKPINVTIRMEHLRDFLCAADCGLLLCSYRSRDMVLTHDPKIDWPADDVEETDAHLKWRGWVRAINEQGFPYKEGTAVFWAGRRNFDRGADVPSFSHDDDVDTKTFTTTAEGEKRYRIYGQMWRTEWIEPAANSPRVRGDDVEAKLEFIVDGSGTTKSGEALEYHDGWLWFRPGVVPRILQERNGHIEWHTLETGSVGPGRTRRVHFGINENDIVNVLATDIARLDDYAQRLWHGYNIAPDGGVSAELIQAQMEAMPAETPAPERLLPIALAHLADVSKEHLGDSLLRDHAAGDEIMRNVHRFVAEDVPHLYQLAKDLNRVVVERIDGALLKRIDPDGDSKWASIRRLEHFLTSRGYDERIIAPLYGVYALRGADAHLPASDLAYAWEFLSIELPIEKPISAGKKMILATCGSIVSVARAIDHHFSKRGS
jgi:hypothetical protein